MMETAPSDSRKPKDLLDFKNRAWWETLLFALIFILIFASYLIFKPLYGVVRNGMIAQIFSVSMIMIIACVGIYLKLTGKLTTRRLLLILFLASVFVHLCYMLVTPMTLRQYDTFSTGTRQDGHFPYAVSFYLTGKLPTQYNTPETAYQFYHPPLNAFIQGMFMRLFQPFLSLCRMKDINIDYLKPWIAMGYTQDSALDLYNLYGANQILSCFYSLIASFFFFRSVSLFAKTEKGLLIGAIFCFFFPRLVQLGGQLNNDTLCVMLSSLSLYFTLRFYKDKRGIIPLLLAAASIGLAMMTKLNGAIIALPMAFCFLVVLIERIRAKDRVGSLIGQYLIFLGIAAPLGLWFVFYSHFVMGFPFGWVFSNLNSALSVADINFFSRFLTPLSIHDLTTNVFFASPFEDYNLPTYLVKTSIFGEFSYWQGEAFAFVAFVAAYVQFFLFVTIGIAYLVQKKGIVRKDYGFAVALILSEVLMMFYFNIKMPYGCTMDFRYIVPILLGFAMLATRFNDAYSLQKDNPTNHLISALNVDVCIYAAASSLFYLAAV